MRRDIWNLFVNVPVTQTVDPDWIASNAASHKISSLDYFILRIEISKLRLSLLGQYGIHEVHDFALSPSCWKLKECPLLCRNFSQYINNAVSKFNVEL
jgi:hypothetical protein